MFATTIFSNEQQHLRLEFLKCIHTLHNARMVHGNIRDTNLLVRVDGTFGIKILDFDLAGHVGVVRYPINVNRVGIQRSMTASDGELVMAEHDLEMLDFMILSAG
jgi:serine/threonine protein kinase